LPGGAVGLGGDEFGDLPAEATGLVNHDLEGAGLELAIAAAELEFASVTIGGECRAGDQRGSDGKGKSGGERIAKAIAGLGEPPLWSCSPLRGAH